MCVLECSLNGPPDKKTRVYAISSWAEGVNGNGVRNARSRMESPLKELMGTAAGDCDIYEKWSQETP